MKLHNSILLLAFFCMSSCHDDNEEAYPAIITELADCPTDDEGTMTSILLDDDTRLTLTNPQTGLKPSVTYRALAGYTLDNHQATLYSLVGAILLHDSTAVIQTDPTNAVSVWRTKRYLNLHLLPKTQGQVTHTWGYAVDSISSGHAYLRLHHRQGEDPTSYTTDVYASLPLDSIKADTISIHVKTFSGDKEWTL